MHDENWVFTSFGELRHADATSDAGVAEIPKAPQTPEFECVAR